MFSSGIVHPPEKQCTYVHTRCKLPPGLRVKGAPSFGLLHLRHPCRRTALFFRRPLFQTIPWRSGRQLLGTLGSSLQAREHPADPLLLENSRAPLLRAATAAASARAPLRCPGYGSRCSGCARVVVAAAGDDVAVDIGAGKGVGVGRARRLLAPPREG